MTQDEFYHTLQSILYYAERKEFNQGTHVVPCLNLNEEKDNFLEVDFIKIDYNQIGFHNIKILNYLQDDEFSILTFAFNYENECYLVNAIKHEEEFYSYSEAAKAKTFTELNFQMQCSNYMKEDSFFQLRQSTRYLTMLLEKELLENQTQESKTKNNKQLKI